MSHANIRAFAVGLQTGHAMHLAGEPGTGKTSIARAVGAALGRHVEAPSPLLRDPSDFAGLPVVRPHGVTLEAPDWARRLAKIENGMLFLDELSNLTPAQQAACLRVILEKIVGDLPLPASTWVAVASNPAAQAADGHEICPPLANRLVHLPWALGVPYWAEQGLLGFPPPSVPVLPESWRAGIPATRVLVLSFLRHRPALAQAYPTDQSKTSGPWPSLRSWEMAWELSAAAGSVEGVESESEMLLGAGCVGDGPWAEYAGWRKALDLPDPEVCLKDPSKFTLPSRGDQQFAAIASIAAAAIGNLTKERWNAAWEIFAMAAAAGAKDVAASAGVLPLGKHWVPSLTFPSEKIQRPFLPLLKSLGYVS